MKKLLLAVLSSASLLIATGAFAEQNDVRLTKADEYTFVSIRGKSAEMLWDRMGKSEETKEAADASSAVTIFTRNKKNLFRCYKATRVVVDGNQLKQEGAAYECAIAVKNDGDLTRLDHAVGLGEVK